MPADWTYDDVPVRVERDEEQGVYKLSVVLGDAVVSFAAVKIGHVDELHERAAEAAEQQPQQPPTPPTQPSQ